MWKITEMGLGMKAREGGRMSLNSWAVNRETNKATENVPFPQDWIQITPKSCINHWKPRMFRGPQFKGNNWMPKTISQELEAQNSKLTATEWCLWQVKCVMVECWAMVVGLQTFAEDLRTITSILFREYQPNCFWDKVSFLPSCLPLMQRRRQHSGTLDILNTAWLQLLLHFSSWNWDKNNRVFPSKPIPNPAGVPVA